MEIWVFHRKNKKWIVSIHVVNCLVSLVDYVRWTWFFCLYNPTLNFLCALKSLGVRLNGIFVAFIESFRSGASIRDNLFKLPSQFFKNTSLVLVEYEVGGGALDGAVLYRRWITAGPLQFSASMFALRSFQVKSWSLSPLLITSELLCC